MPPAFIAVIFSCSAVVGGGSDTFDVGVETIFESFQNPVINKHLAFVLFDAALAELFPELLEEK